ncbi:MAG: molybdopterin-synthase adenylyltransferase MoeB [Vulcanimicrobiota bacterium]
MPTIMIPTALRRYSGETARVEVQALTVGAAMQALTTQYPDLRKHLYDDQGKLRSFVNLYLGDEDVRYLQQEETPLEPDDELLIIPSIAGGIDLTPDELARYDRHLTLPEVGLEGQKKLKAASVLMVGTGGLGSPLGLYLAAAGVGRLGIVDFDVVDASNLQRQVMHGTKDVGRPKIASARERLADINPLVKLETYETALVADNALEILKDYDVVVDGTDNFATRYLVNDACVLLGKPNVYGSIFRFEGQVSVFHPAGGGPCYRCLYPEPPPPGLVPSCAEGGVLGVLPGVVGTLQATETIKLILGVGNSLLGRLLTFDALAMKFRELKLRRAPDCPLCGPEPTVTELIDYEEFCGLRTLPEEAPAEVTPAELKQEWDAGSRPLIVDVRQPHEWDIANLADYEARLIPLGELGERLAEIPPEADVVVQCKSGGRSAKAQAQLLEAGYPRVRNLTGGILRWADEVDPSLRKY